MKIIVETNFNFRFYTFTLWGIVEIQIYADQGGSIVQLLTDESVKILAWLTIILQLPFITKAKEGAISYNPQQVVRQLGDDQSAVQVT